MDATALFSLALNVFLTFAGGVLGFFVRELWGAVKGLRKDLDDLRVHIAQNYVSNEELKGLEYRLIIEFNEIKEILRTKADK
jgi:hypothetical protein